MHQRLYNKYFTLCSQSVFFYNITVHFDIIRVFYLPTDAEENCFKNIKIYIKTTPTCFGVITIIRERIIRTC